MKMKVKVDEQNKLYIDDNETGIDKLNSQMLEKILENGLSDNVEFSLPEDTSHPIVTLIKEIKDLTENGSEFRKNIEEIIKEQESNEAKILVAENSENANSAE